MLCAGAALLGLATVTIAAQRSDAQRPDIVFILLDDLRWDALSFMDHPYV